MSNAEVLESHPLRVFERNPDGGLPESEVSLFLARSGVGKTTALINFALDSMLAGNRVFHFSVGMMSDKVHEYYKEVFQEYQRVYRENREMDGWKALNDLLMVISYHSADRMMEDLENEIQTVESSAHVEPALILVDGLDFGSNSNKQLETMAHCAKKYNVRILATMRIHRNADGSVDLDHRHEIARKHARLV